MQFWTLFGGFIEYRMEFKATKSMKGSVLVFLARAEASASISFLRSVLRRNVESSVE